MVKNKIKIILFFLIIYSNLLNCKNTANSTKFSLAESSYFEANQWDFIDNLVIKYPDGVQTDYGYIPLIASIFTGIFGGMFVLIDNNKKNAPLAAIGVAILCGYIARIITKKIIGGQTYDKKIFKVLKWFIFNYNPDLSVNSQNNVKKFIPNELQKTFDNMYLEYIVHGDKYLMAVGIRIIYEIRKKIMYEIKVEEYKKPNVINIHNSSYLKSPSLNCNYPTYNYSRYRY